MQEYERLLGELDELMQHSELMARGGNLQPTQVLEQVTSCAAAIERIRELDGAIMSIPSGDPAVAGATREREAARQKISTILMNFARIAGNMDRFRSESIEKLKELAGGMRAASAYRDAGRSRSGGRSYQQRG